MPTYDAMPLLNASFESIMNQTHTNWVCVSVNNRIIKNEAKRKTGLAPFRV